MYTYKPGIFKLILFLPICCADGIVKNNWVQYKRINRSRALESERAHAHLSSSAALILQRSFNHAIKNNHNCTVAFLSASANENYYILCLLCS